ncbi:MFS transporter [Nocardioides alcanivorans]|uniref:MFS transporter n=1 Tax=Nocardioides alcanivorans TaxID=2897352 RepID=UPI001F423342|nr:MFS transporter [Nocardioides alcanivorans]
MSPRHLSGAAAAVVTVSVPPFLVGALTARIGQDLEFGTRELGIALAGCYTVTAALSPVAGRLVARIGAGTSLRIACLMTTAGLVGIATATSALQLILSVAFVGIPNALTQPSSNELLAQVERPRLRAFSFGLVQAAIPTATLIAGAVLAVASYSTGWRASILTVAVLSIAAQFVLPREGEGARITSGVPSNVSCGTTEAIGGRSLMAALVVSGCLGSAAATALPSFAATTGLAVGTTAWVVAGAQITGSLVSILVRVAAPVATSHASLRRRLHAVAGLQALGLVAMLGIATETPVGFVVGSIAAFGFGWGWNGLYNLVVALARPSEVAAATGLSQAGVFLGGTVGPLAFAMIARDEHFGTGWLAMAGLMSLAALAALHAARRAGQGRRVHRLQRIHS